MHAWKTARQIKMSFTAGRENLLIGALSTVVDQMAASRWDLLVMSNGRVPRDGSGGGKCGLLSRISSIVSVAARGEWPRTRGRVCALVRASDGCAAVQRTGSSYHDAITESDTRVAATANCQASRICNRCRRRAADVCGSTTAAAAATTAAHRARHPAQHTLFCYCHFRTVTVAARCPRPLHTSYRKKVMHRCFSGAA